MPLTRVQTPDGEIITVDHPEGASDQDIIAYAQQQYQPPSHLGAPSQVPTAPPEPASSMFSLAQQQARIAGYPGLAPGTPGIPSRLREAARSDLGRFAFPALGALVGSALGPAGFWGGLAAGSAGAGGGELLRQAAGGEDISPGGAAREAALGAAPALGIRYLGGPSVRLLTRYFPGAAAALQQNAVANVRRSLEKLHVPDVKAAYEAYELQKLGQLLGTQTGPTPIPLTETRSYIKKLISDLAPPTPGWPLNQAPALQESLTLLDNIANSSGSLPIEAVDRILRVIGPRIEASAGVPRGAMRKLYQLLETDLENAAMAGSQEAALLLGARQAARRARAIEDLKTAVEKTIRPVEGTPGLEQIEAASALRALPKPRSVASPTFEQTRLAQVLTADELSMLRGVLEKASQAPKIETGIPALTERLVMYIPLSGLGYMFGGAEGIVVSAAGAEMLRRFFMTPTGMRIALKLARANPGSGWGTRLTQAGMAGFGNVALASPTD